MRLEAGSVALFAGEGAGRRALLIERAGGSVLEGTLAFPGGRLEEGEDAEAGALRELREETGLVLPRERLEPAGDFLMEGYVPAPLRLRVFTAHLAEAEAAEPVAGDDAATAGWRPVGELLAGWAEGRLPLSDSVRAILEAREAGEVAAGALELRRGVQLLALPAPTLPPATHTNCYLLGTGEERILVDPGADDPADARPLLEALDALAAAGIRLREVWLTHHHRDHHAALPYLRARQTIRCRAHPLTARALPGGVVDATLRDEEVVELPGPIPQRWRVVATPGHTGDHLSFFEEARGSLLCGDHLAGVGTVIIDPPDGDLKAYLESLDRLEGLGADLLLPAHGPPSTLVGERIRMYRAHRLAREAAILAAMEAGAREIPAIVAAVYTDVPTYLHVFAERSVLAHLLKLEVEKRVLREGERWEPIG
ncbi:MAG: MBL fold metallo-hydrolase [Deltaproteobacteria bacterium]|nr:MBL fold metallo-hydrolase [Deltaproteobacteria bacterium]